MSNNTAPQELVELTRYIGQPHMDYVIIGEGNTSYQADESTFWIKASGHQMNDIQPSGFVQVHFEPILAMLENPPETLTEQNTLMKAACVDPVNAAMPSVEVTFHAALLKKCNARYIVHTHPSAVNRVLCSNRAEQFANNRLFPDEVVLCGPKSVFVPYVDPGLPLALTIRDQVRAYIAQYEEAPKVVLLANHGLIAIGQTATEARNITAMCVKGAGIFAGACTVGEPVFMSEEDIMHIYRRPDEIYRRKLFVD